MPASRCAPSWTKRNIPKASRFPISRWLPSTSPATRSMATGTIRFHLIEKIIVQNELTELFMDEPLGRLALQVFRIEPVGKKPEIAGLVPASSDNQIILLDAAPAP